MEAGNLGVIFTALAAIAGGYLLYRLKVPGGIMVGAIIGVAVLNITFGIAYMPTAAKTLAQIVAGAYIGVGIDRSDLQKLRSLLKPLSLLVISLLILNLLMGFLIYITSPLDLLTALFSAVPGGMSDIPIIAADMGADASKVAALQFVRMCAGIAIFPTVISYLTRGKEEAAHEGEAYSKLKQPYSHLGFAYTAAAALIGGAIGKAIGIPAGALLFALIAAVVVKVYYPQCCLPTIVRRLAQVLAGAYIGSGVTTANIVEMGQLAIPALILVLGYFIACLVIGWSLKRFFGFGSKEAMLVATPAGASDMALIAADVGVESPRLIVMQIGRMLVVIMLFPQIISWIAGVFVK